MRFTILYDSWWEARIDKVTYHLSDLGYRHFFDDRNYGSSLEDIVLCLMCSGYEHVLKRRIRQSKKEKILYIDIMLDLSQFKTISQEQRNQIVIDKILDEVPTIVKKYKFKDFDTAKFESDLKAIFS